MKSSVEKGIVNTWDLWEQNWEDAKRFFTTKGNLNTKEMYKVKWHNNFFKALQITAKAEREKIIEIINKLEKLNQQGKLGVTPEYKNGFTSALIELKSKIEKSGGKGK